MVKVFPMDNLERSIVKVVRVVDFLLFHVVFPVAVVIPSDIVMVSSPLLLLTLTPSKVMD